MVARSTAGAGRGRYRIERYVTWRAHLQQPDLSTSTPTAPPFPSTVTLASTTHSQINSRPRILLRLYYIVHCCLEDSSFTNNYPALLRFTPSSHSSHLQPPHTFLRLKMGTTDLEQLIDMGFDKQRAEMAVKKTGGRKSSSSISAP